MAEDANIIAKLNARDESALADIRGRYGALCSQMAHRVLGDRDEVEECMDDMLLAVWESIPPQHPESLRAYLIALIRRAAIDRVRHETRQKRGGTQFALALDELTDILPSGEHVEEDVERRALSAAVRTFLDGLKPQTRRIFLKRYYLSWTVQEIAAAEHLTQSAVKMTLLRTRKKLGDFLGKEGML